MTLLTRCPAIVDRERSEADYRDVLLRHGRKAPEDPQKRKARALELKRVLACHTECQKLDDLSRREPRATATVITWPVVHRSTLPTKAEIQAHRARLLGKKPRA